jgi:LCP family protein required for cell wall assembly
MKLQVNVHVLRGVLTILVILLLAFGCLTAIRAWENKQGQLPVEDPLSEGQESQEQQEMTYFNGDWYVAREDIETLLVLGLDKFEEQTAEGYLNNEQADFILLLVLDHAQKQVRAIQLNRDTMTEIQILGVTGASSGSFTGQLALAHTYGSGGTDSCANAATAVSKLLYGASIDHYVSMTMDGVARLDDLVGGVSLEILDDFSGIDDRLVKGETVKLDGQMALTYVRARGGLEDSTNLRRMERQRQYLGAFQEQLEMCVAQDSSFILESILQVSDYLVSDCTVEQLSELSGEISQYGVSEIETLEGETKQGEYMEFYADEQALQALVMDVFYTRVP